MNLQPDTKVEVWLANHTIGESAFRFYCAEPDKPECFVPPGEYRAKLAASAKGFATLRRTFLIAATTDGPLEFAPE